VSNDYGSRVEDMLVHSEKLAVQLNGVTFEQFRFDERLVWITERLLMIIGEAAWKLPRLERGQFREVPWRQIVSLRHRLVHNYGGTDVATIYDIATAEVARLIAQLKCRVSPPSNFPFPIKICGLSTPETMTAALEAGADMVGLVFHRKSPRSVSLDTAAAIAAMARGRAIIVALTVDPSDEGIDAIMAKVNPDLFQLHGSETSERCAEISARIERPVMKALGVAEAADLAAIKAYRPHLDRLLLDAKPPKDAAYPGGHGKTFDWAILKGLDPFMPFMLSGGLTPENVGEAIRTVKGFGVTLAGVDVSSGVESAPGVKSVEKIKAFIENARNSASS
jgi:phosphoribosylanthranilate isomerase